MDAIIRNVEFRGVNLWTLVFAILIASVGLNVDSTAVVIGAMLISPLMGPIVGIGLGLGINDFSLVRKAGLNLGIAVLASVLTSGLYFWLTPLSDASSELLARTTPTIWDVLIAFFGGMAGIVAGASKDKGNVIPGVAIATALMPPLCTAGYGLATGNLAYFLGAFYLFFINSVMIALSTFLVVRLLDFPEKQFVDVARGRIIRWAVWVMVGLTVVPSIYLGFRYVQEVIFLRNAARFVQYELRWDDTQVVSTRQQFSHSNGSRLEVLLVGVPIKPEELSHIRAKMTAYGLEDTELVVRQSKSTDAMDVNLLKKQMLEEFDRRAIRSVLTDKEGQIEELENRIQVYEQLFVPVGDIATELKALYPEVIALHMARIPGYNPASSLSDTVAVALLRSERRMTPTERTRIASWLSARTGQQSVRLVVE
jgi:uncharacterized hydrophobic protein (TIGR00271 family)